MDFDYKTRGNSSPNGKSRILFVCHPEDFEITFQNIVDEILSMHDCAIWYLKNTNNIDDKTLESDLAQMQCIIVPVTIKLLTQNSYVTTKILPLAFKVHVPVCPIIFEEILSNFISQDSDLSDDYEKIFGKCQYLNKYSKDVTAISYEEKFSKFLQSVLTNNELIEKIRSAFDALVFLSYRKKDRIYAQQLMRLIHKNEFCRQIAIWYDEFLVPGEDFSQAIIDALEKSDLFALVVTPNLVNEVNYVMTTEYPFACKANKPILPVKMAEIDNNDLKQKFDNIPNCIEHTNDEELSNTLKNIFPSLSKKIKNTPEHRFFIGLAYLGGVYVEVNYDLGLSMIESSANENLPEAMEKLSSIYRYGIGVDKNFEKALFWQNRLIAYYKKKESNDDMQHYCLALWDLASIYQDNNKDNDAVKVYEKLYQFYQNYGKGFLDEHELTIKKIKVLYSIARIYAKERNFETQDKAFLCYKDILKLLDDSCSGLFSDALLEHVAETFDEIGIFVANIPHKYEKKIEFTELLYAARKIRRTVEASCSIDFETVFNESVFYYPTKQNLNRFIKEAFHGEYENLIEFESVMASNQNIIAEELLFLSLAVYEYLGRKNLQQYYDGYRKTFSHIADVWMSCGYFDRAIETYKLNYDFIEKYSKEFYVRLDTKIADSALKLGKAYLHCNKKDLAIMYFKKAITLLKTLSNNDILSEIKLAEAYQQLALTDIHSTDDLYNLEKAIEILERIVTSEFSTVKLNMELVDCYCSIMQSYVLHEFWNSKQFFNCFNKALKICTKYYDKRKSECSAYLSKMHCLCIFMENCKSIESINRVSRLFDICLNNCNVLFSEDSADYYPNLHQILNQLYSFQQYATKSLEGDILEAWEINIAKIIAKNLSNIIEYATENPKSLLPYDYRTDFTDYVLLTGGVDGNFIHNFKSSLFMFWDLFITYVYKKDLLSKEVNVKEEITKTYDSMIKLLEQGYAFQIFQREKDELLKHF